MYTLVRASSFSIKQRCSLYTFRIIITPDILPDLVIRTGSRESLNFNKPSSKNANIHQLEFVYSKIEDSSRNMNRKLARQTVGNDLDIFDMLSVTSKSPDVIVDSLNKSYRKPKRVVQELIKTARKIPKFEDLSLVHEFNFSVRNIAGEYYQYIY